MNKPNRKKYDNMDLLLYAGASYAGEKEAAWFNDVDPNITLSEKADKRIYRKLKRRIAYDEKRENYSPILENLKRVAVVVLAILSMSFAGALSIEAVRVDIYNAIIEWFDKSYRISFEEKPEVATEWILEYKEPQLPKEYSRYEIKKDDVQYCVEYENEDTLVIYRQRLLQNYSSDRSNENTLIEEIQINGYNGVMEKYTAAEITTTSIIWHDNTYVYSLSSDLTYEELLKIAETVK